MENFKIVCEKCGAKATTEKEIRRLDSEMVSYGFRVNCSNRECRNSNYLHLVDEEG
ncbi:MAG: hypothetical protein ACOCQR_01690 [bacterium]